MSEGSHNNNIYTSHWSTQDNIGKFFNATPVVVLVVITKFSSTTFSCRLAPRDPHWQLALIDYTRMGGTDGGIDNMK